ncbi:MAG: aromatic hydrocarbon degradation protein [Chitinophagaceae bacterium]|nr:aromatic hydrocarbon degradation protein [Chitinophagaceae bacterium]
MKKIFYISSILFTSHSLLAQIPEDAIRLSWITPSGTARHQAIGGAMGSLGGEITSGFVNPAGLGLYKTSEIVFSPGLSLLKGKSNFRETNASTDRLTRFNFGTSGVVWGHPNRYGKWVSNAFSFAVNRTANFNNRIYYRGQNNESSFSEAFAEEFSNSGLSIDDVKNSNLSLGTKMAIYTYLIDTATIGGQKQVIGRPEYLANRNQELTTTSKGGITELTFGAAGNMDDKLYVGGSLGVPILNYSRERRFVESDPANDTTNEFGFSRFEEDYSVKGIGLNVKLGLIFKPADYVRIGLAVHSPTIYGLKDEYGGKMVTDVERLFGPNDKGVDSITSDYYFGSSAESFKYDLISPWKVLVSASYVLHETENVTKQKGFITADVEYVTHKSSKFSSAEENGDDSYYKGVNNGIKQVYKNAFNFRVGGELKFKTIMTRLGFALFGDPYKQSELKARRMNLSGGLGYRNKGIFVDLTYVHSLNKDVNFPYRLADKPNTFADVKDSNGNVLLTVGFKF